MSNNARASTAPAAAEAAPKSYYEQQRELLILEIAQSLNNALHNLNAFNRSLEEVIQVGNEFAPVESLWSHFESVMGDQGQEEKEEKREGVAEEGASTRLKTKMHEAQEEDDDDVKIVYGIKIPLKEYAVGRVTQGVGGQPTVMINVNRCRRMTMWN